MASTFLGDAISRWWPRSRSGWLALFFFCALGPALRLCSEQRLSSRSSSSSSSFSSSGRRFGLGPSKGVLFLLLFLGPALPLGSEQRLSLLAPPSRAGASALLRAKVLFSALFFLRPALRLWPLRKQVSPGRQGQGKARRQEERPGRRKRGRREERRRTQKQVKCILFPVRRPALLYHARKIDYSRGFLTLKHDLIMWGLH